MADKFYPPVSDLLSLNVLPEELSFLKGKDSGGLSAFFDKIYYRNLRVLPAINGGISYSIDLLFSEELELELPGTGISLILNKDFTTGSSSIVPISFSYQMPIHKYLRNFQIENFSFDESGFYDIIFSIKPTSDTDLILQAITAFIDDSNPVQEFADRYEADTSNTHSSLDTVDPDINIALQDIVSAMQTDTIEPKSYIADFYINGSHGAGTPMENFNQLFSISFGTEPIKYITNLFKPTITARLALIPGIEFPRNILKPLDLNYEEIEAPEKFTLLINDGSGPLELFYSTNVGFGFSDSYGASPASTTPFAEIGNTGFKVEFGTVKLDLSKKTNIPEADNDGRPADFTGAFVDSAIITIPERFVPGSGANASLIGRNLLIGTGGLSGTIGIELNTGVPGGTIPIIPITVIKNGKTCSSLRKCRKICITLFFLSLSQFTYSQNYSLQERIVDLSYLWEVARNNFPFFESKDDILYWDSLYQEFLIKEINSNNDGYAYYQRLNLFYSLLNEGHADIQPPKDIQDKISYPKLHLKDFDRKIFVVNSSKRYVDKIPIGSEILSINSIDIRQFLKDSIFPFISASTPQQLWNKGVYRALFGKKGTNITVQINTPAGVRRKVIVKRAIDSTDAVSPVKPWKAFSAKMIDSVSYIELNTFNDETIIGKVDSFLSNNNPKGLILDIRENGGGSSNIGLEIIKRLTRSDIPELHWKSKMNISLFKNYISINRNSISDFKYDGWYNWKLDTILKDTILNDFKGHIYEGPLIVLTSSSTVSAAEDFLVYLDQVRAYTQIGQITAGSTGESLYVNLTTGGKARVPSVHVTTPNDVEYVRKGIKPDIEIYPSVEEYINKNDPVLIKALKILK